MKYLANDILIVILTAFYVSTKLCFLFGICELFAENYTPYTRT